MTETPEIPEAAIEDVAKAIYEAPHDGLSRNGYEAAPRDIKDLYRAEARLALAAAVPHLNPPITSREPEGEALEQMRKWYADIEVPGPPGHALCANCEGEHIECSNCGSAIDLTGTFTASEVKELTETATRLGVALGRKEALEEAAAVADELADGVVNREKRYNEAFIHACGCVARAIREDPRNLPPRAAQYAPEPLTAPSGDSDLPPTPEAPQEDM